MKREEIEKACDEAWVNMLEFAIQQVNATLPPKLFTALTLIAAGAPLRIIGQPRLRAGGNEIADLADLDDDQVEFLGDISSYEDFNLDVVVFEWKICGKLCHKICHKIKTVKIEGRL